MPCLLRTGVYTKRMSYSTGDEIAGKYKLIESIGGGAMGQVFKAEHLLMHKAVAIKILHQTMSGNAEIVERFKREAQAAAAIDHSNICTVMDFDVTDDGDFYLVMELLEGETLQQRLKKVGRFSPARAVFIMQQLQSVLQCAHDYGIVHRDVKPENITLINKDGTNDFVKLLDFGIAHQDEISVLSGSNLKTQMGYLYGTPQYIAPEQATGDEIDYRVDLYACGCVLFEMLMGYPPFQSDNIINILHMQAVNPPPHIDVANIECGEQFDVVIQKLLKKDRTERYQSALSVSEALGRIPVTPDNELLQHVNSTSVCIKLSDAHSAVKGYDSLEPDEVKFGKRRLFMLLSVLVGVFILAGVLTAIVLTSSDDLEEVQVSEGDNVEPQKLAEIAKVQPFVYTEDFAISDDETLRKDPNLLKAVEAFYQKDYQLCYDNILAVEGRYKNHPNYLRLRMQAAHMLVQAHIKSSSKDDVKPDELAHDIIKNFVALTASVKDAVRNSAIREAIFLCFYDSKEKISPQKVYSQMIQEAHENLPSALAYAIVYSPYDYFDTRKKRMIAVYDELVKSYSVPEWQKLAVDAWRISRDNCNERAEIIKNAFSTDAPREDVYYGLLVPLYNNLRLDVKDKNKRYYCKARLTRRDCNYCMKNWIESGYADWTKLLDANSIQNARLPFLKENAPDDENAEGTDDETSDKN